MHSNLSALPLELQVGAIETRGVQWGEQLVRHLQLPAGTDFTPLFADCRGTFANARTGGT
jgi:hypothetical protein